MNLPSHKAGLYLTHNQHKDYYESIQDHINKYPNIDADYFVSPEDMQKCIDTDELWELQWYPETPISFHKVIGSSLEIVLKRAMEIEAKLKERNT